MAELLDEIVAPNYVDGPGGQRLAYVKVEGKSPTVVFLGGFMSDMTGSKALRLEEYCRQRGCAYLRFDYSGHGASEGAFADGTIKTWADDAAFMLESLTEGPLVLVGSSMGGWIACLMALRFPNRINGFIGIAAAPDFTERMWAYELSQNQRDMLQVQGRIEMPSEYGPDPYVFTRALFDDGKACSVLDKPLKIDAPVRLLQGVEDSDVPWDMPVALGQHMYNSGSSDVSAIIVPGSDHRMSSVGDLDRLISVLEEVLK